jgi:hypothetical protein
VTKQKKRIKPGIAKKKKRIKPGIVMKKAPNFESIPKAIMIKPPN